MPEKARLSVSIFYARSSLKGFILLSLTEKVDPIKTKLRSPQVSSLIERFLISKVKWYIDYDDKPQLKNKIYPFAFHILVKYKYRSKLFLQEATNLIYYIMDKVYFKYKEHPGDLLRDSAPTELPDPKVNLEEFLIWFLEDYQGDSRVTYLDDLYKLLFNEFSTEADEKQFLEFYGRHSLPKLKAEIKLTEHNLLNEAYQNFYFLLSNNIIEILGIGKD